MHNWWDWVEGLEINLCLFCNSQVRISQFFLNFFFYFGHNIKSTSGSRDKFQVSLHQQQAMQWREAPFQTSWVVKHYPLPCNNWQEQIATQLLLSPFSLKISHVTKYWRWAELCSLHHSLRSCTNPNCFYDQTESQNDTKETQRLKRPKKSHFYKTFE